MEDDLKEFDSYKRLGERDTLQEQYQHHPRIYHPVRRNGHTVLGIHEYFVKNLHDSYGFRNDVVITFVIMVSGLFLALFLVVLCLKASKNKKNKQLLVIKQSKSIERIRNHPYLVTIVTGSRMNAGTNGFVRMKVHGKSDISKEFYLNPFLHDPEKQVFKRGKVSRFVLFTKEDLGDLYLLEVDLQSEGPTSWFLSYVVIQDMMQLTQWYFPFHDWIETTGDIVKVDLLAGIESSGRLLLDNIYSGYRKNHVWYKLISHLKNSTRYNAALSLTFINTLILSFMFVISIPAEFSNISYTNLGILNLGQFYTYSLLSICIVCVLAAILEIILELIEHKSKFEDLDSRGTLRLHRVLISMFKLEQIDYSVWKEDPNGGGYLSFNYFDDAEEEEKGDFHRVGYPYHHNNLEAMIGIKSYGTCGASRSSIRDPKRMYPNLETSNDASKNKVIPQSAKTKVGKKNSRELWNDPNKEQWKDRKKEPVYACIAKAIDRMPDEKQYARNLALASDSTYKSVDVRHFVAEPQKQSTKADSFSRRRSQSRSSEKLTPCDSHDEIEVEMDSTHFRPVIDYSKSPKHDLPKRVNSESSNRSVSSSKSVHRQLQKILAKRLENFIDKTLVADSSRDTSRIKVQKSVDRDRLKEQLEPLISSFVNSVKSSVIKNREIDERDLRKLEGEIVSILEKMYTKEIRNRDASRKASSVRSNPVQKKVRNNICSDTALSPGVSNRLDASSNVGNVSDTACFEREGKPYKVGFQSKEEHPNDSVSRKVSDVVLSNNINRLEKKADVILQSSKRSREKLLTALCKSLDIDSNLEDAVLDNAKSHSDDGNPAVQQRKKQLILEKIFPKTDTINELQADNLKKLANATLQGVLKPETKEQFEYIVSNYGHAEMNTFASEVVDGLYHVVKKKLEQLILLDMKMEEDKFSEGNDTPEMKEDRWKHFQNVMNEADMEIKNEILPLITEHIMHLIEEEAHTLESLDVDLMMMAFGGQFVDTVITNAVLQTHVGVAKYCKTLSTQEDAKVISRPGSIRRKVSIGQNKSSNAASTATSNQSLNNALSANDQYLTSEDLLEQHYSFSGVSSAISCSLATNASKQSLQETISSIFDFSSNFHDVKSLINEQIVAKVLQYVHERLGHKSNTELESFMDNKKICCKLCKPKIINDLVKKIPHMSAARYITEEVLDRALIELEDLKGVQLQEDEHTVASREDSKDSTGSNILFCTIGEIIALDCDFESDTGPKYSQLIEEIVNDLSVYIMETACDTVAELLIDIMEEDVNNPQRKQVIIDHVANEDKDEACRNINHFVEKKVRQIIDGELKKKKIRNKNNQNNSAKNVNDNNEEGHKKGKPRSEQYSLARKQRNVKQQSQPNNERDDAKEPLLTYKRTSKTTVTIHANDESTYHTYRYDDSAKYVAGDHCCLYEFVYSFLMCLTIVSFVGTLIIGIGFNELVALHWLGVVILAVLLHIVLFQSLKIFVLGLIATYAGHRLL